MGELPMIGGARTLIGKSWGALRCLSPTLRPLLKAAASREGVRAGQEQGKSHPSAYRFAAAVELPSITPHPSSMHADWAGGNDLLSVRSSTLVCELVSARIEVLLLIILRHAWSSQPDARNWAW